MRSELFGEEMVTSEDHVSVQMQLCHAIIIFLSNQRARLLNGTEKLAKTSDRLDEGYRITQETEEIGLEIMDNLQRDRETMHRMRGRVSDSHDLVYLPQT